MRSFLNRVVGVAWVGGVALFGAVRFVLDVVGYVSAPDDAQRVLSLIDPALRWVLAVPQTVLWPLFVSALVICAFAVLSFARSRHPKQLERVSVEKEQTEFSIIVVDLQKSRGKLSGFRTRVDKGSITGRPIEQLRRLAQEHRAVLRSLEKRGFIVPYLDVSIDPIGYMDTAIEHADTIIPLLKRDLIAEAKAASAKLAEQFRAYEASHTGF